MKRRSAVVCISFFKSFSFFFFILTIGIPQNFVEIYIAKRDVLVDSPSQQTSSTCLFSRIQRRPIGGGGVDGDGAVAVAASEPLP